MENDFATGYAIGQNDGKCNSNSGGMWGDGSWIFALIIIALLFGGGLGFGGGFGGFGGGAGLQGMATRADITAGFQFNNIENGIRDLQHGLCDSTYAINNTLQSGFHSVDNGFCSLSRQLSECCCDNRAAVADLKYTVATESCATRNLMQNNTRDIIDANNANTRSILDFIIKDKIDTLTAENQNLKLAASQAAQNAYLVASQEAQTAELIRRLGADYPSAAYLVQPPTPINFPTNGCGTVNFGGRGGNCGCGCGAYAV